MKINFAAAKVCNRCHYYSGSGYLPCAVHPYLQADCPDFQQKEDSIKPKLQTCDRLVINTITYDASGDVSVSPCGWYRVLPRRHNDSMPAIADLGEFEFYGVLRGETDGQSSKID
jgi:hypothetical protein